MWQKRNWDEFSKIQANELRSQNNASDEEIQELLAVTEREQTRADIAGAVVDALYLALAIAKLPNDQVWKNRSISKTQDLENIYHHLSSTYKRIGQSFLLSAFNSANVSIGYLKSQGLFSDDSIVELFKEIEIIASEKEYIRREKVYAKATNKTNIYLIHRIAESWFREWAVVMEAFPSLIEQGSIDREQYRNASTYFYKIIERKVEKSLEERSYPFFEFSRKRLKENWDALSHTFGRDFESEKADKLLGELKYSENVGRHFALRDARVISSHNEALKRKINLFDQALKELSNDITWELYRRGNKGFIHPIEIWEYGKRYKLEKKLKKRDPYEKKPMRLIIPCI